MDLVWPESQDSFPKEQADLRVCATASPDTPTITSLELPCQSHCTQLF